MKKNKRVKVLLKVTQRTCNKIQEIQEVIDASMIEVCAEEGISSELAFLYFAFSLLLSL